MQFALSCSFSALWSSDIPVTETQTDTEMIDISKTHTETNTEKIFNTDTIYIKKWTCKNLTETVIEMILKTDTEIICLPLPEYFWTV